MIPLANFKNASGPLLPRLSGVYLLQFVQRGSWDSRFFTVDQIQVEGTGVPISQRVAGAATGNRYRCTDGRDTRRGARQR